MTNSKHNRVAVLAVVLVAVLVVSTALIAALNPVAGRAVVPEEGSEQLTAGELAEVMGLDVSKWHVRHPEIDGQCRVRVWVELWRDGKKVHWNVPPAEQADRYPLEDNTTWSAGAHAAQGEIILKLPSASSPFWYFAESGASSRMDCSSKAWAAPLIRSGGLVRSDVPYEPDRGLPEGEPILLRCVVWAQPGQSRPAGSDLPDRANPHLVPEIVMADDRDEDLRYLSIVLAVKMQIDDVPLPEGTDTE